MNPSTQKKTQWDTCVTRVAPNSLLISGFPLEELIAHSTLLQTAHLLVTGEIPSKETLEAHLRAATEAALLPAPRIIRFEGEDISQTLAKCLLMDERLASVSKEGEDGPVTKTIFALGRVARYLASILGNEGPLEVTTMGEPFSHVLFRAIAGDAEIDEGRARMIEAMIVASVDHGVTPPSAQATIIGSSVRGSYEMAVANGVGAITDVHGGAGAMAAAFFQECVDRAEQEKLELADATHALVSEYVSARKRIKGLGHRVHSQDPRRNILWELSGSTNLAGPCVTISKIVGDVFQKIRNRSLPINVDGVIGAIVADMGLSTDLAKALFVYGRVAGLSAHHFEEIATQRPMRRINFSDAIYAGKEKRPYPA